VPKFVDFVDGVTHTHKKTKSNDIVSALPTAHHKTSQHVPWCPNADSNENVFSFLRNESVDRSSFTSVVSLFHARGAATETALSLIRRHVRGLTRLPHDEARGADRAGISVTGASKSEMYSDVCPRSDL